MKETHQSKNLETKCKVKVTQIKKQRIKIKSNSDLIEEEF